MSSIDSTASYYYLLASLKVSILFFEHAIEYIRPYACTTTTLLLPLYSKIDSLL